MGYYTRVFCKSDKKPTIDEALEHLNKSGHDLKIKSNSREEEQNTLE